MGLGTTVGSLDSILLRQKLIRLCDKFGGNLCKSLAIAGLVLYILYIFQSYHPCCRSSELLSSLQHGWNTHPLDRSVASTTNISHIVFGIAGVTKAWKSRRPYIEAWWRPNITRGFIWLDRTPREHLPWPSLSSPPFRVSEETSRFKQFDKHVVRDTIRLVRVILETFRSVNKDVRWYVIGDDDTIFFVDNLVEVLARYDHNKYFYVGQNSECLASNSDHAFEMAFGGAGYALSYPLVEVLAKNLDDCIKQYPTMFGSDRMSQVCIADLGVSLTHEPGFHQIDLHRDISGLLSAHPPSPLISLHHLDHIDPIFPSMDKYESLNHLMEAEKADSSRLLQQTICYYDKTNWSFSISWGYSVHIYEKIHHPSILQRPLETFIPWKSTSRPPYMFNSRSLLKDPCEAPHVFFFESVEKTSGIQTVTKYTRRLPRKLPTCLWSGNHSADHMTEIRVFSPTKRFSGVGYGRKRECCDIVGISGTNVTEVELRTCHADEAAFL